jgi:hypothetical protein
MRSGRAVAIVTATVPGCVRKFVTLPRGHHRPPDPAGGGVYRYAEVDIQPLAEDEL